MKIVEYMEETEETEKVNKLRKLKIIKNVNKADLIQDIEVKVREINFIKLIEYIYIIN